MTLNSSLIFTVVTAFAAFLGAVVSSRSRADSQRIARLERKLDMVLNHLGITDFGSPVSSVPATTIGSTYSVSVTENIMNLMRQGKKIEAIKEYRKQNPGIDLLGAKNAVEQIERTGQ